MAKFTMDFYEEGYGRYGFEAKDLEEAKELHRQLNEGEIEPENLPSYWVKYMGGETTLSEPKEVN